MEIAVHEIFILERMAMEVEMWCPVLDFQGDVVQLNHST